MKKIIILMLVAIAGITSARAAKVTIVTVDRNIFGFTQIVNECPYDIHFYESDDYMVRVVGPSRDVNYIRTVLRDGILTVTVAPDHRFRGTAPYVELYCPKNRLVMYTGTGAGNFIAMTALNLLNTIFTITGAGNVTLGIVNAVNLDLRSHGAGNINVTKGNITGKHTITQKGTGKVNLGGAQQASTSSNRTTNTSTRRSSSTTSSTTNRNTSSTGKTSSSTNKTTSSSNKTSTSTSKASTTNRNTSSGSSSSSARSGSGSSSTSRSSSSSGSSRSSSSSGSSRSSSGSGSSSRSSGSSRR
ncbi:MAG: DUF2807 domain-containing protein [Prevotellaceae bacterium]|nr:DUF2807 domain-containing protein [Prevotellaceae bacterium]